MSASLRSIISWFKHVYVDDVLAEFHTIVAKLEKVSVFHTEQVALHDEEIKFREAAKAVSEREVAKAKTVATKIRALLDA
jgi:hypothetical protein